MDKMRAFRVALPTPVSRPRPNARLPGRAGYRRLLAAALIAADRKPFHGGNDLPSLAGQTQGQRQPLKASPFD
jgi:hypothetical protein